MFHVKRTAELIAMPGSRCTKGEKQRRLALITRLVCAGATHEDIRLALAERSVPRVTVSRAQLAEYMMEVERLLRQAAQPIRRRELGLAITRLNMIFSKAYQTNDLQNAIAALKELHSILGLRPTIGGGGSEIPIEFTLILGERALDPAMAVELPDFLPPKGAALLPAKGEAVEEAEFEEVEQQSGDGDGDNGDEPEPKPKPMPHSRALKGPAGEDHEGEFL